MTPVQSPILIVIFGLPGTGKTTLAKMLVPLLEIKHFNTDKLRGQINKRNEYDEEDKARVYNKILDLTRLEIEKGRSVLVDGTFYKRKLRMRFLELADRYDASVKWIEVCAREETIKKRVSKTRQYSEADYAVYQKIKKQFEPMKEPYLQLFSDFESISQMIKKSINFLKQ